MSKYWIDENKRKNILHGMLGILIVGFGLFTAALSSFEGMHTGVATMFLSLVGLISICLVGFVFKISSYEDYSKKVIIHENDRKR